MVMFPVSLGAIDLSRSTVDILSGLDAKLEFRSIARILYLFQKGESP
jgi:hypothetical protein